MLKYLANFYLLVSLIILFFPITNVEVVIDGVRYFYPVGINFTIVYHHSVEKQLVVEKYYINERGIYLVYFYTSGCGSGLPCREGDFSMWSDKKLTYLFIRDNNASVILDKTYPVIYQLEIEVYKTSIIFCTVKNIFKIFN